jgi:hypothetical protein
VDLSDCEAQPPGFTCLFYLFDFDFPAKGRVIK